MYENMEFGKIVKTFKSKSGREVTFRYLSENDFEDSLAFANELIREDTFVGLCGKPLTRVEEKKWIQETLAAAKKGDTVHLIVLVEGRYAGNADIRRYRERRKKHVGNIGISLSAAYRDEGIGTQLIKTLIVEAKRMGLRLLTLGCFENNPRALHIYEKLGFKRTGIVPHAIFWKNSYVGEVLLYLSLAP